MSAELSGENCHLALIAFKAATDKVSVLKSINKGEMTIYIANIINVLNNNNNSNNY